jgi:hypothetical protein
MVVDVANVPALRTFQGGVGQFCLACLQRSSEGCFANVTWINKLLFQEGAEALSGTGDTSLEDGVCRALSKIVV